MYIIPDLKRIVPIIVKIANGHIAFEHTPLFENPIQTKIEILPYLFNHQRVKFETVVQNNTGILPEVGSRAFINFVLHNGDSIYSESEGN